MTDFEILDPRFQRLTITSALMIDSGAKTRTRALVRSRQKLPMVRAFPAMPRTTARAGRTSLWK